MWDNLSLHANDMAAIMRKHGWRWAGDPGATSRHLLVLGLGELALGERASGRRRFVACFRQDPLQLRAPIYLLLSFLDPRTIGRYEKSLHRVFNAARRRLGLL
jgi:hypothetical protein